MKRLLTISLFISALTTTASAGFIDNKTLWDQMSNLQKTGYVQGVFDFFTQTRSDNEELNSLKEQRLQCLVDMDMTAQGVVDLVDTMYQNDISIWKHPPFIALINGLTKCVETLSPFYIFLECA